MQANAFVNRAGNGSEAVYTRIALFGEPPMEARAGFEGFNDNVSTPS